MSINYLAKHWTQNKCVCFFSYSNLFIEIVVYQPQLSSYWFVFIKINHNGDCGFELINHAISLPCFVRTVFHMMAPLKFCSVQSLNVYRILYVLKCLLNEHTIFIRIIWREIKNKKPEIIDEIKCSEVCLVRAFK